MFKYHLICSWLSGVGCSGGMVLLEQGGEGTLETEAISKTAFDA